MLHFFTQLTSLLLAHSLLIGAGAFMLLRGALSRSLSAAIVERVMHHVTPPLERVERNISVLVNFVILILVNAISKKISDTSLF